MFYIDGRCLGCGEGLLGFYRAPTGQLMLLCDECELAWRSPDDVSEATAFLGPEPAFPVGGWASLPEINKQGWAPHVKGEAKDYRD